MIDWLIDWLIEHLIAFNTFNIEFQLSAETKKFWANFKLNPHINAKSTIFEQCVIELQSNSLN